MGKRELVIVAGFVLVGALVYALTAPAPTGPGPGFSFAKLFESFHRQIQGARASASVVRRDVIKPPTGAREVRVSNVSGLTVIGEARADIAYELTVQANGIDQAAAETAAQKATLRIDDVGPALALRPSFPPEGRPSASLTLRIPARLFVRMDGLASGAKVDITNVASLEIGGVVGDVHAIGVAGAVTGAHRNGKLFVEDSGSVNMTLTSTDLTLTGIKGAITLTARNGRSLVERAAGPIEVDHTDQNLTLVDPAGPIRISGTDGRLDLQRPRAEVRIDGRRTRVTLTLDRATPVTVFTTDQAVRLELDGAPAITLDAVTTEGGHVDAHDFDLTAESVDQESRLAHVFGTGGGRVALRNQRADIVIVRAK